MPLYSVTMDQGMVRRDSLDREFASNAPDEANLRVFKDDHVYNMMRMWQGAVGRAPEDCMVSPAYVVLQPQPDTDPAFFDHWFKRRRSIYLMWAYSYGLTSDRLRLYARDFGRVPMALPRSGEQQKIADFLGTVDERIKLLQRRRDALARYKTGMMQRLFGQSLRFTRDDGSPFPDWINSRLGEISYKKASSNTAGKIESNGGNYPIYGASGINGYVDFFDEGREYIAIVKDGAGVGRVMMCPKFSSTTGTLDKIFEQKGNDLHFIFYYLQSISLSSYVTGSTIPHIYFRDYKMKRLKVPHLDEQRKIADCLDALDGKVSAVSAQVRKMQDFKKSLLQQMFV